MIKLTILAGTDPHGLIGASVNDMSEKPSRSELAMLKSFDWRLEIERLLTRIESTLTEAEDATKSGKPTQSNQH